MAGAPGRGHARNLSQLRRADPARQAQPQLSAPARRRMARDLARTQQGLQRRGARAHFAARDHKREGGAREGARAADDRAGRRVRAHASHRRGAVVPFPRREAGERGGGEGAAGGRGARAGDDDQEQRSQLPHDQCA